MSDRSSKALLVNALTFARVPLIFGWAACAIVQECFGGWTLAIVAMALMLLSGLTDLWDGKLARKWQVVSTLGKMADPLMDKVFYIVAFPILAWQIAHQGESGAHALFMTIFCVLYFLRDTWVTFMRSVGVMYKAEVGAMMLGKVRTALSFPGAGWVYVYLTLHSLLPALEPYWLYSCYVVEGFLMLLTVWSLFTYTAAYLPYLKKALAQN